MAVLDRLFHRRPVLTAPAIDKTAEAPPPGEAAALDHVSGFMQPEAAAVQDESGPEHWEPECGTPVHSTRHRVN